MAGKKGNLNGESGPLGFSEPARDVLKKIHRHRPVLFGFILSLIGPAGQGAETFLFIQLERSRIIKGSKVVQSTESVVRNSWHS